MKNNRKTKFQLSDYELFNAFKDFCYSDEDCIKAVSDAKKAYLFINQEKLF